MKPTKSQLHELAKSLRQLKGEGELNPLRQSVLQQELMARLVSGKETSQLPGRYLWLERKFNYMYALVSAFLAVVLTGGTVFASQGSLPGDTLYPVKRLVEQVELSLVASEKVKVKIEAGHATERLDELTELKLKAAVQTRSEERIKIKQREEEARLSTQADLETTLNVLNNLQVKLEGSGQSQAAASIRSTLENLVQRAGESEFKIEVEAEHGRIKVKFSEPSEDYLPASGQDDSDGSDDESEDNSRQRDDDESTNDNVPSVGAGTSGSSSSSGSTSQTVPVTGAKIELEANGEIEVELEQSKLEADTSADIKEDDNEIFCRGEWRRPEECDQ